MDFYVSSLGSLIASVGPIYITDTAQRVIVTTVPVTIPNGPSTLPGPSPNVSPSPLPSPTPDTKSSGGLSTGAIIGIAVGAVVVVLAIIIALLVVYCMRRRDKNRQEPQAIAGNHGPPTQTQTQTQMQTQPLIPQNVSSEGKLYQPVSQQELNGPETPLSPPVSAYTETKSIPTSSPPPPQQPPNYQPIAPPTRRPVPSTTVSDTDNHTRYSEVPSAFSAPLSPSPPHPNASEVYGDIYRGQTSRHTSEVEGMSQPLQSSGQMPHELEYRYHDTVFEAPGSTMFRTPSGHNLHEMESDERYAQ